MPGRSMDLKAWGLLFTLALLWASSFLFVEIALSALGPLSVVLARVGLAALLVYAALRLCGQAMPLSPGLWGAFFVMGALLDAVAAYTIPLGDALAFRLYGGLAVSVRVPFALFPDVEAQGGSTAAYFYDKARFLYPETGLALAWHVTDTMDLVISSEVFFPIYHLWDGENREFFDEAMVSTALGLSFRFPPPAETPSPPS